MIPPLYSLGTDLYLPDGDELMEHIFGEPWELVPQSRQNAAELAFSMRFDPPAMVWRRVMPLEPQHFNCRCMLLPRGTRMQMIDAAGKVELCKT